MTTGHHGILFDASQFAKDLQMGVSAAPVMRPEFPPAVAEFFAGYGITAGTKTPAEAMRFVKYISYEDAGVGWFFRQQLRPSPVKKQNQHPDLKKLDPRLGLDARRNDKGRGHRQHGRRPRGGRAGGLRVHGRAQRQSRVDGRR